MAKTVTMADKVREHTKANPKATAKEIAQALGTKIQYVHSVWYLDRKAKKAAGKRKVGRPRKFVTPVVEMKPLQREGAPKNGVTLDKIHETTSNFWQSRCETLEAEVADLKAVIRYLEGRLYGAPV